MARINLFACESCHIGGRFRGTPQDCSICHSLNGLINAEPKSADHVLTTGSCESCHRSTLWEDVSFVDHTEVLGTCESCHNGILAEGKHATHIPAVSGCEACHSTVAWGTSDLFYAMMAS